MTRHKITLGKAQSILRPRMQVFTRELKQAVTKWNGLLISQDTDEFARGVLINQFWNGSVNQALQSDNGVRQGQYRNGRYFVIEEPSKESIVDTLMIRLKHVDQSYDWRNYPTERNQALETQQEFATIPSVPRLVLGYRLDLTGTQIENVMVIFKNGKKTIWRWQVWGHPISEFASAPHDIFGHPVYSHDDFSKVV